MDGKITSASSEPELGQQLRRASKIARLSLSEAELDGLLKDAQAIFEKFSEIEALEPSSNPRMEPEEMQLREDGPVAVFESIGKLLDQVPKKEGRLIRAPKSL